MFSMGISIFLLDNWLDIRNSIIPPIHCKSSAGNPLIRFCEGDYHSRLSFTLRPDVVPPEGIRVAGSGSEVYVDVVSVQFVNNVIYLFIVRGAL